MRRGTQRAKSRRAWAKVKPAILLAAVLPAPVWASDILWNNGAGGDFQTGANWVGNAAPGSGDVADFSLPNTYTVTFSANATTSGLAAHGGNVTLNLSGFSFAQNA